MISFDEFLRNYDVKKLDERFPVSDFDCGDEDLNDFLKKEVFLYKEQLLAMPYVLTKKDDISKTLAYFTLANDKISVTDFPLNSVRQKARNNFARCDYLKGTCLA